MMFDLRAEKLRKKSNGIEFSQNGVNKQIELLDESECERECDQQNDLSKVAY
jgi:hypothetical protein